MNLHNYVPGKMEYIHKVFLGVQDYMQKQHELDDLIAFLDAEPPEFRSVAYESASMELALLELSGGNELTNWKKFYQRSAMAHTFHNDIGLGWAFAKREVSPTPYLDLLPLVSKWMVYDGIGYYYGLFKGRATVKNQIIPDAIDMQSMYGFDQGLGRRLWYISKGNVNQLFQLLQPYHLSRLGNLWRGVGIACGYVGGNDRSDLEELVNHSAACKDQFCTGVGLAAISRNASNSITNDIESACEIICGMPLQDVLSSEPVIKTRLESMSMNVHIN